MGKNDRQILSIMCISRVHQKIIFHYFEGNSTKITVELHMKGGIPPFNNENYKKFSPSTMKITKNLGKKGQMSQ